MLPFWTWFGYAVEESKYGFLLSYLPINTALVLLDRRLGSQPKTSLKYSLNDVGIYTLSNDCVHCPFTLHESLNTEENEDLLSDFYVWQMSTVEYKKWRVLGSSHIEYNNDISEMICEFGPELGEFGVYKLDLDNCKLKEVLEPINIYCQLALFCFIVSLLGIFLKKWIVKYLENEISSRCSPTKDDLNLEKDSSMKSRIETGWLSSLYIFRGFLLYLIIFLTTGAGGYDSFTKNLGGVTWAECLFFAYVWTIGFKIPINMNKIFERDNFKLQAFCDISKLFAILVLLGTLTDNYFPSRFEEQSLAIWCSLQKFGVTYFFVGTAYIFTVRKFETNSKALINKAFAYFKSMFWCWIIVGCLFVFQNISIKYIITFDYSLVSDIDSADSWTTEGTYEILEENEKVNESIKHFDVVGFTNKMFIASQETMPRDSFVGFSKGAMGFITTIIICFSGIPFGMIYLQNEGSKDKIKLWGVWTTMFGFAGVVLAVLSSFLELSLWPFATIFLLIAWTSKFYFLLFIAVELTKKMNCPLLRRSGYVSMPLYIGHVIISRFFPLNWNVLYKSHLVYLTQNLLVCLHWLTIGVFLSIKNFKFGIEI